MSITFTPGVWGLLGANGAGKTTLMRMAALKGLSRAEAARKIDALLEQVSLTEVRKKKIIKLSGGECNFRAAGFVFRIERLCGR